MFLKKIYELKAKIASKQAGKITVSIDLREEVVTLSSVLLSDRDFLKFDLEEFVLKRGKNDLFLEDDKRFILRKKFSLRDRKQPLRHMQSQFSKRAKELLDELLIVAL